MYTHAHIALIFFKLLVHEILKCVDNVYSILSNTYIRYILLIYILIDNIYANIIYVH